MLCHAPVLVGQCVRSPTLRSLGCVMVPLKITQLCHPFQAFDLVPIRELVPVSSEMGCNFCAAPLPSGVPVWEGDLAPLDQCVITAPMRELGCAMVAGRVPHWSLTLKVKVQSSKSKSISPPQRWLVTFALHHFP